jgi:putative phosphoesterase
MPKKTCLFELPSYNFRACAGAALLKIGVISDTHLGGYSERLADIFRRHLRDCDLIVHAGDLTDLRVLDVFEGKEVKAVHGNMDSPEVRHRLPDKCLLEVAGHRIGLIHGWGSPFGIEHRVIKAFEDVDCLIYGHTHQAVNDLRDRVLFFNPGSATGRFFTPQNTIGILVVGERIEGEIIRL